MASQRTAAIVSGARLEPPAIGDYMAGARADRTWRIVGVTALRQAGKPEHRYRLQCETADDVPPGAVIHPWRLVRVRPPLRATSDLDSPLLARMGIRDRAMLERLQIRAPLLLAMGLEPLLRARSDDKRRERQRIARIGRDHGVVNLVDQGAPIRLETIRDAAGKVLRDVDVVVNVEPEEPGSRRMQRRARRVDPLATLLKYRSISQRQYQAAETLRKHIEIASPGIAATAFNGGVHVAPWMRAGVTRNQIVANTEVREAFAVVAVEDRLALAWMIGGGTLGGLSAFAHIAEETAAESLRSALAALEDFYFG